MDGNLFRVFQAKVNFGILLHIQLFHHSFGVRVYSYALDLSFPNRKRLEVYKNVKYIAVTSRASKLQVFKVQELRDLKPVLPRE